MQKIIGVTELQRRFKAILDEVVKDRLPYVLLRGSRPEAALIAYEDFLRLQKLQEKDSELRERWAELRERLAEQTRDLTDAEVEAEVAAAVAEVRAERGTSHCSGPGRPLRGVPLDSLAHLAGRVRAGPSYTGLVRWPARTGTSRHRERSAP